MRMTRKDFVKMAAEILAAYPDYETRKERCEAAMAVVRHYNHRFDEARFRKACGL